MTHSRLTFKSNRSRSRSSAYQDRVGGLLARIERYSRERRRLATVRAPAALASIDEKLEQTRAELAALVADHAGDVSQAA